MARMAGRAARRGPFASETLEGWFHMGDRPAIIGVGALCCTVALSSLFALGGCSLGDATEAAPHSQVPEVSSETTSKRVTIPDTYFRLKEIVNPQSYLEAQGYEDVTANDDGSHSATMPADDYEELVREAYDLAVSTIKGIENDERYPDAVSVDYDEQFATVTVLFSTMFYSVEEALVAYAPGEAACMYQQIAGLPVGCDVIIVGPDGSELSEDVFPKQAATPAAAD